MLGTVPIRGFHIFKAHVDTDSRVQSQPPVGETQPQSTVASPTSNSLICTGGQMRSAAATFHTAGAQTEVTARYCVYTLISLWS